METKTEITKSENGVEVMETTPATLIQIAVEKNVDIDKLEKLMQLQERWEANKARKEFFEALADFQYKCPVIKKTKMADFPSSKGGRVKYAFAPLDQIISQIREALKDSGLSYRWEFAELNKEIQVTCLITHKSGHTEKTTFSGVSDNSGSKNEIQSDGSSLTYMRRYTLCGALGITSAEEDVDGEKKKNGSGLHPDMEISINDCKTLQELNTVWDQNQSLHNDAAFKQAVTNRKKNISNGK